ncbi:MAG: helix-turn-helix domain-containing protein [Pseudomonadota bacterium]
MAKRSVSLDTLGARLAYARKSAGLSTAQLSRRLGVGTKTMAKWEADQTSPRTHRLTILAGMLGVSAAWLLSGKGEAPGPMIDEDLAAIHAQIDTLERAQSEMTATLDALRESVARFAARNNGG